MSVSRAERSDCFNQLHSKHVGMCWGILGSGERRYLVVYDVALHSVALLSFFIAVKTWRYWICCDVARSLSMFKYIKVPIKLSFSAFVVLLVPFMSSVCNCGGFCLSCRLS